MKGQVQALDRSQLVLPMMPGMPERRTHDCVLATESGSTCWLLPPLANGTSSGMNPSRSCSKM